MPTIDALTLADQVFHSLNDSGYFERVVREYQVYINRPEYTQITAVWGGGNLKAIAIFDIDDVIVVGYVGSFTFANSESDFIAVDDAGDAVETFMDQLDNFWEMVL